MKNAQTCADTPAGHNVSLISKYEFLKCKKPGQFQTPCRHSPSSHDTRYVTSLHHSNYNYRPIIMNTF